MDKEDLPYNEFASLPDYKILNCNVKKLNAQEDKRKLALFNTIIGFRLTLKEISDENLKRQFILDFAELRAKKDKTLILSEYNSLREVYENKLRKKLKEEREKSQ